MKPIFTNLIIIAIALIILVIGLSSQQVILKPSPNVYDDMGVSMTTLAATSPQTPTWDQAVQSYAFANNGLATQQYVFLTLQLPHSYKEGTDIECHIHWEPSSTNTGSINFSMRYDWFNFNKTNNQFTNISAIQNASGVAYQSQIMSFPILNGTGKTISSILKVKLMRESASSSDTFTGSAYVDFFDCHFQKDSEGSIGRYLKWG